jgi:peptidyl-prolyl cis-trans isomerase SurA
LKLPSTIALVLALAAVPPAIAQAPAPTAKPTVRPAVPPPATSQRLDGIAAVVNDEAVLQSDVEEQLYLFLMRSQTEVDSATVDTLRAQILNQLIDEKLILGEAQRQGVTVSDAEVNKQAQDALADTKGRFETPAAYQDQLRKENMTEDQLLEKLRTEARRQALVSRLMNKQVPHRQIGALEAETYFKAHKDKFPHAPAELRLSVIQIPAMPDSAADAKAKARAEAVRKRIVSGGEKFAKVAAEASDDENSARAGGDLGYLVRGSMDPAFEKAVFGRKLNTVEAPVRTIYGWHVVEVLDRDTLKTKAGRDTLDQDRQPILEAHVRHVLIRVPLTDADVERTRKLAEGVRAQAVAGKPFADLAKQYNRYAGPHTDDGDIGFLPLTSLQTNIRAGLDSVQVGGVSQVLVNQAGFNIFRVTERKADREYELEEIKGELPGVVSEMLFREKLDEWVKGLRAKAHIQINKS